MTIQDEPLKLSLDLNGLREPTTALEQVALSDMLYLRYIRNWNRVDLDESIRLLKIALFTSDPQETTGCWEWTLRLCRMLEQITEIDGANEHMEELIVQARDLVLKLPDGHALLSDALRYLGIGLRTRYNRLGNQDDLKEALLVLRMAVASCHEQGYVCSACLRSLGVCLQRTLLQDLSAAELCFAYPFHAAEISVPSSLDFGCSLVWAGVSIPLHAMVVRQTSMVMGGEPHLRRGIDALPALHPDRSTGLYWLAAIHGHKYDHTLDLRFLHQTIEIISEALAVRPKGHPRRPEAIRLLSTAISKRYSILGGLPDLDRAAELSQESLDLTTVPSKRTNALEHHAVILHRQFEVHGHIHYLEDAISLHRQALACSEGSGEPHKLLITVNLARALVALYTYLGEPAYLEEGIVRLHNLLDDPTLLGFDDPAVITNLASALVERYRITGIHADLAEAVELCSTWLQQENVIKEYRDIVYVIYGNALLNLHASQSGLLSIIDEAIDAFQNGIALREPGHPLRHEARISLGNALVDRFQVYHATDDLKKANSIHQDEYDSLPEGHPQRALASFGLARVHILGDQQDFSYKESAGILCQIIEDNYCHPEICLSETLAVLELLRDIPPHQQQDARSIFLKVYRRVLALLPQVAFFGLNNRSKLRVLEKGKELALIAAIDATRLGKVELALEIIEEGRAVFWTQHLRLRTSFDSLPSNLSQKLSDLSNRLRAGTMMMSSALAAFDTDDESKQQLEADAARMRKFSEEFTLLVDSARKTPGNERFMMSPTFSSLAEVARHHPVVVLLATTSSCFAILLKSNSESATAIELTDASSSELGLLGRGMKKANTRSRSLLNDRAVLRVRQVNNADAGLSSMWTRVMSPIIKALGLKKSNGRARPRLTICPTGIFTHLPLHACHSINEGVSDYCVTSYTPTLTALLEARRNYKPMLKSTAKVLLAAVSHPFRGVQLHSVIDEAHTVAAIVPAEQLTILHTQPGQFAGPVATVDHVHTFLEKTSLMHLACHGEQNMREPLESGFLLQDGKLTIARLMALNLPMAFLAFLSACETAKGDAKQPDQAIHLAATMLYAGFKSVVGTMWSMNDADGPVVAKSVYGALYDGESEYLDPNVVPYALDEAVQELRKRGYHPSRWAPYIHMGM